MTTRWYRNKVWNAQIGAEFDRRFDRSKASSLSKYKYLSTQADLLYANDEYRASAISLYERAMEFEGPARVRLVHWQRLGMLHLEEGDAGRAKECLRHAIVEVPAEQRVGYSGHWPGPPEEDLVRIVRHTHPDPQSELADLVIPTPLARVPDLQLLREEGATDLGGDPLARPQDAAESLLIHHQVRDHFAGEDLNALFAASPRALDTLDRRALLRPTRYRMPSWQDVWSSYLPCLAAYIGRVLVRDRAGTWLDVDSPWDWAVAYGGARVELLPIAHAVMWHDHPLRRVVPQ